MLGDKDLEIARLKKLVDKYNKALDEEVWCPRLSKFVKLRELQWVAKVLNEE